MIMLNTPLVLRLFMDKVSKKIERKGSGQALATLKQKSPIIEMTGL
ncbi:hypothetical protein N481_13005 [Pseudoalteromonas luteoviolacea S4047-1]|nr:hypothetical protein N481_13005 [Pseudoalteromonas luteoviolacea S4047-1]